MDVSSRFLEAFMHELISLAYEPCASQGGIVSNLGKGKLMCNGVSVMRNDETWINAFCFAQEVRLLRIVRQELRRMRNGAMGLVNLHAIYHTTQCKHTSHTWTNKQRYACRLFVYASYC